MLLPRHNVRRPGPPKRTREPARAQRRRPFHPVLECLEDRVLPAVHWSADADGFWDDPANWTDDQQVHRVPGPSDDAVIDRFGSTPTVTIRHQVVIASLSCQESLVIDDASLRVDVGMTLDGTLYLGAADGSTSGILTFFGNTAPQSFGGTGTVVFGLSVSNAIVNSLSNNHPLTIESGLTFQVGFDGGSGTIGTPSLTTYTINEATVRASRPETTLTFTQVDNRGTVLADTGARLVFNGNNWVNYGTIRVTGARLETTDLNNDGLIEVTDSDTTLRSFNTQRFMTPADLGVIHRVGGTFTLFDATLDLQGGTLRLDGVTGPWLFQSATLRNGTLDISDPSYFDPTPGNLFLDAMTVRGTIDESQGGVINVKNGLAFFGTWLVGGAVSFWGTQTLSGGGRVVLGTGSGHFFGARNNETLTIAPGITVAGGDGTFGPSGTSVSTTVGQGTINTDVGTLRFPGSVSVNGMGGLGTGPAATIQVDRELLGDTRNADAWGLRGRLRFGGTGAVAPSTPQRLEVMSSDVGAVASGFSHNFAYGKLELASRYSVKLVDLADNAAGAGPEALYVGSLVVPSTATLDLNGLRVYALATEISGAILNGSVTLLADSGPLTLGTANPGLIATSGEVDEWTFTGYAGRTMTLVVNPGTSGSPPALQPPLQYAQVRVLDAAGNVVAQGGSTTSGQVVTLSNFSLAATGVYRVQIQATAAHPTSAGNYVIGLYDSTPDVARLEWNERSAGQIENSYSTDRWLFAAGARQGVQFDLLAGASGLRFKLTGPGGAAVFTDVTADTGLVVLPATGDYVLTAYAGAQGQNGDYTFRLLSVAPTDLALNAPFDGTLAGSGQYQIFRINIATPTPLLVTLDHSVDTEHTELYVSQGSVPLRSSQGLRAVGPGADQQILVPLASPGAWFVIVYAERIASPSPFRLLASAAPLLVSNSTPSQSAANTETVMAISGGGFVPGTTVGLVSGSGTTYAGTVDVQSNSALTARFAAGSVPAGVYSLRVARPDGAIVVRAGALTVAALGSPVLSTRVTSPLFLSYFGSREVVVEYSNLGTAAALAPVLVLSLEGPGFLTLDPKLAANSYATSVVPQGFSDTVQILASGAIPGLLLPGESARVPVYWGGMLQPWRSTAFHFRLAVSTADQTDPIDWPRFSAAVRPAHITPEAWTPVFANLQQQVGSTWGDYVRMLDENAAYLGALGRRVIDVRDLFAFELHQAEGLSPITQLVP
jgi:hypothetical protein